MPNPFDFVHEIRDANEQLIDRLDAIIEKIDELIEVVKERSDWYGDGR